MLRDTSLVDAKVLAERIRATVEKMTVQVDNVQLNITISIGATDIKLNDLDINSIFNRADEDVYKAKSSGRNRIGGN